MIESDLRSILADDPWSTLIEFIDFPSTSVLGNFFSYSAEVDGDGHEVMTDMPQVLFGVAEVKLLIGRDLKEGDRIRVGDDDFTVYGDITEDGFGLGVARLRAVA